MSTPYLYSTFTPFTSLCHFRRICDIPRENQCVGDVISFLVRVEQFLLRALHQLLREFDRCFLVLAVVGVGNVKEFPHGEGRYHLACREEALHAKNTFILACITFYGRISTT